MPQVAAYAIVFLAEVGTAVAVGFTLTTTVAAIVGGATLALVAYGFSRAGKFNSASAGPMSRQLMVRSTQEPVKIVYGRAVVSGPIWWMNTSGGENKSLWIGIILAGHECEAIQGYFIDEEFIDIADVDTIGAAGAGDVTGDTEGTGHRFSPIGSTPVLYFREYLGTAAQAADSALVSAFSDITTNHRLRGITHVVVRCDDIAVAEEVWARGAPNNIKALVDGKLVYDPRLDSTFTGDWGTGSGAHRLATPSTWAWSDNPALCLADYLIDSELGPGWDSARIDYNSVAEAADDCDQTVDVPTSATEARFTCNGVLSASETHAENIRLLLECMAGRLQYVGDQWRIQAGVWVAPVYSLDESDLIGPIEYRKQPQRTERFNGVRGSYFDPDRQYQKMDYLQVVDTTTRDGRDNGREIFRSLDLPLTNSETMAQRLATRLVAQCVYTGILIFPTGYQALDIAVGDTVSVSLDEMGWDSKMFRVLEWKHADFRGITLMLKEDSDSGYADPAEEDYGTRTAAGVVEFPRLLRPISNYAPTLIGDPFFSRSTRFRPYTVGFANVAEYFWGIGGITGSPTYAIQATGGVNGGLLAITIGSGDTLAFNPYPRDFALIQDDEYVRVNIRMRKTSNPTLTAGTIDTSIGISNESGNPEGGDYSVIANYTAINAWTVDVWQTFEIVTQMQQSTPNYNPYASLQMILDAFSHDIDIEFDSINMTRISTP